MRILLVTWDGGGNVPPTLELGRRLLAAGHDVAVLGPPWLEGRVVPEAMTFLARADDWDPLRIAFDTSAAIEQVDADVVVADYMLPPAICAAVSIDRPVVALVHTLFGALLVDGAPSPMSMAVSVEQLNGVRRDLGLQHVDRLADVLDEADRVIVAAPVELDLVPAHRRPNIRYVGPLLDGPGPDAGWTPPVSDRHPLVVVSLGTTPMDEGPVVQDAMDALGEVPVRVLAMLPRHLDPSTFRVPGNTTVCGHVRHAAVFPHAAAVVSHAGLGTVSAALAHGRPLVCVPLGRDQPDNAAAVARVGAGVVVTPSEVSSRLPDAVEQVLGTSAVADAAGRMAAAIAAHASGSDAVAAVVGTG